MTSSTRFLSQTAFVQTAFHFNFLFFSINFMSLFHFISLNFISLNFIPVTAAPPVSATRHLAALKNKKNAIPLSCAIALYPRDFARKTGQPNHEANRPAYTGYSNRIQSQQTFDEYWRRMGSLLGKEPQILLTDYSAGNCDIAKVQKFEKMMRRHMKTWSTNNNSLGWNFRTEADNRMSPAYNAAVGNSDVPPAENFVSNVSIKKALPAGYRRNLGAAAPNPPGTLDYVSVEETSRLEFTADKVLKAVIDLARDIGFDVDYVVRGNRGFAFPSTQNRRVEENPFQHIPSPESRAIPLQNYILTSARIFDRALGQMFAGAVNPMLHVHDETTSAADANGSGNPGTNPANRMPKVFQHGLQLLKECREWSVQIVAQSETQSANANGVQGNSQGSNQGASVPRPLRDTDSFRYIGQPFQLFRGAVNEHVERVFFDDRFLAPLTADEERLYNYAGSAGGINRDSRDRTDRTDDGENPTEVSEQKARVAKRRLHVHVPGNMKFDYVSKPKVVPNASSQFKYERNF